jgi:hypothetical protein
LTVGDSTADVMLCRAMRRRLVVLLLAALALPFTAACPAAPRGRPVKAGPTDTGAGSLEDERRRLKGTWQLESLQMLSQTGETLKVQASGVLTYDDYGNLTMKGTVTGSTDIDPSALNIAGRVTIDPDTHTLRILDVTSPTPDARRVDPSIDPKHVRHYEFLGVDELKTTVVNAAGQTTATALWKRQS